LDVYYFRANLTPQLSYLINELGISDGMPYTVDSENRCDQVLNEFFLTLAAPGTASSATWRTYAEQLSLFFRFLDGQKISWNLATQDHLLKYYRIRRIQNGPLKVSGRSWNVFVAACRRFYEWAVRNSYVVTLPFKYKEVRLNHDNGLSSRKVTTTNLKEKASRQDVKYMSEEDFSRRFLPSITNTRNGTRNALFVRLLMRSGLRVDEAVQLKTIDLPDPDNPKFASRLTCQMQIIGKGKKWRTVLIPKTWLRDVRRYIEWERADAIEKKNTKFDNLTDPDQGYLFLTEQGKPITYAGIYSILRSAGKRAGFDFKAHPHMLRHSYAIYQLSAMIKALLKMYDRTNLSNNNAYQQMIQDPLRKLQLLMGHASISTTFIYLDYVDDLDEITDVSLDDQNFDMLDNYLNQQYE